MKFGEQPGVQRVNTQKGNVFLDKKTKLKICKGILGYKKNANEFIR